MTMRAGRQAGVDGTERRRFLAALGGLGGALGIAAAFVFVPSARPTPPPAPRIHVELPQPAALAAPPARAAIIASLESDTANRPLAPGPRPLAPDDRPSGRPRTKHQDGRPSGRQSPLPAAAVLPVGTAAPRTTPTPVTQTVEAVRRDAAPTISARALADLTPPDEAPAIQAANAREDEDHRDPVTGAFVTAASHIGGGFRTMGRAIRKVF